VDSSYFLLIFFFQLIKYSFNTAQHCNQKSELINNIYLGSIFLNNYLQNICFSNTRTFLSTWGKKLGCHTLKNPLTLVFWYCFLSINKNEVILICKHWFLVSLKHHCYFSTLICLNQFHDKSIWFLCCWFNYCCIVFWYCFLLAHQ